MTQKNVWIFRPYKIITCLFMKTKKKSSQVEISMEIVARLTLNFWKLGNGNWTGITKTSTDHGTTERVFVNPSRACVCLYVDTYARSLHRACIGNYSLNHSVKCNYLSLCQTNVYLVWVSDFDCVKQSLSGSWIRNHIPQYICGM